MRRILIETSLNFKHIGPVGSFSPLDDMSKHIVTSLVKKYDNGIEVYRAPFDRLLFAVPETHPVFGFYAMNFDRNNYYMGDAFPDDKKEAVKRVMRGVLTSLQ